jgi:hypothetical protein
LTSVMSVLEYIINPSNNLTDGLIESSLKDALNHLECLLVTLSASCAQKSLERYFEMALLLNKNAVVRREFSTGIEKCLLNDGIEEERFVALLTPTFKESLKAGLTDPTNAILFLETLSNLVINCKSISKRTRLSELLSFEQLWTILSPSVFSDNNPALLTASFKIFTSSLHARTSLQPWVSQNLTSLLNMISLCLLNSDGKQKDKPVLQSVDSRTTFFNFLLAITEADEICTKPVFEYFIKMLGKAKWRKKLFRDWNLESNFSEVSRNKYSGLINLSSTCYLNSIMQQIFMLTDFRDFLIDAQIVPEGDIEENVIFQVTSVLCSCNSS